jgi:hypothetical protein
MSRWVWLGAVLVAAVVGGLPGMVAPARAAPAGGSVCKSFSASGLKPKWSVIGNVTCGKAKPWLVKILADRGQPGGKAVIKNAPRGFRCSASNDAKGRPFAGACYTGTLAFPKNGFQWLA